jgi:hypothetical protein
MRRAKRQGASDTCPFHASASPSSLRACNCARPPSAVVRKCCRSKAIGAKTLVGARRVRASVKSTRPPPIDRSSINAFGSGSSGSVFGNRSTRFSEPSARRIARAYGRSSVTSRRMCMRLNSEAAW